MKKISIDLSVSSIEEAIREIEEYKRSLVYKTAKFVERLADIGIPVIDANMNTQGDSSPEHNTYVKIRSFGAYSEATLVLQGRDILFIEFGAGVHYNGEVGTSPNPKGEKMKMTIGSYGKGQGANDSWVYFSEEDGRFKTSHGTKASMPMYNAGVKIRQEVIQIAKEVFGG